MKNGESPGVLQNTLHEFRVALRGLFSLVIIGAILGVALALWGIKSHAKDQDTQVVLKVVQGAPEVSIDDEEWQSIDLVGSLSPGDALRLGEGDSLFLGFSDGSYGRLKGPGHLEVLTSHRSVLQPPALTRILSRVNSSVEEPPPASLTNTIRLKVRDGELTLIVASPTSAESSFQIEAAGSIVRPSKGAIQIIEDTRAGTFVLVGNGTASVGLLSRARGTLTPVVIPKLGPALAIQMATVGETEESQEMMASLNKALPQLIGRGQDTPIDETTYLWEAAEPSYFVGVPPGVLLDLGSLRPQVQPIEQVDLALGSLGVKSLTLTDEEINESLPQDTAVHLIPGSQADLRIGEVTYRLFFSVEEGRVSLKGLPLGIDPVPRISDLQLPYLLSIFSSEGELTALYLGEDVLPPELVAGSRSRTPDSLPRTTKYFESIPTPREVSLDAGVIGANLLLAAFTAAGLLLAQAVATRLLVTQEETLVRLLLPLSRPIRALLGGAKGLFLFLSRSSMTFPIQTLLLLTTYGAVYSFLAQGAGLFGRDGLFILVAMTISVGLVTLADPLGRSVAGIILRIPGARVQFYPGNLLVAAVSVGASRILSFTPGLIVGMPGGFTRSDLSLGGSQRTILILAGFGGIVTVALISWSITFYLPRLEVTEGGKQLLQVFGVTASHVQDILLLTFLASVSRIFFSLLPLRNTPGHELFRRSWQLWLVPFSLSAFVFWHLVLNKESSASHIVESTAVLAAGSALAFAAAIAVIGIILKSRKPGQVGAAGV